MRWRYRIEKAGSHSMGALLYQMPRSERAAVRPNVREITLSFLCSFGMVRVEPCRIFLLSFHGGALYASSTDSAMPRKRRGGDPCECSSMLPVSHTQYHSVNLIP